MDNEFTAPNYADYPHFFSRLKQVQPEAFTASFSNWGPIAQTILRDADVTNDASGEEKPYATGDAENALAVSDLLREGDPTALHEARRRKMAEARHRRREKNLKLRQPTLPMEPLEGVANQETEMSHCG